MTLPDIYCLFNRARGTGNYDLFLFYLFYFYFIFILFYILNK